jgi:hypothetical protein
VKDRVGEVSIRNVLTEVLAGNRGFVVKQFDADVAVIGLDSDHDVSHC